MFWDSIGSLLFYNIDLCSHISYNTIVATKGGETISEKKKMGRPTDSPKEYVLRVRLDKEYEDTLNTLAKSLKMSKSDIVRKGIDLVSDTLDEK